MTKYDLDYFNNFMVEYKEDIIAEYEKQLQKKDNEIERLNNIINNLEKELARIYEIELDYPIQFIEEEIEKVKLGVDKE